MNKATESDGIPGELFQILKDDATKVLHSIWQQIWKTQQWPQDWKRSVFIPTERKAMPKNAHTTTQLHSSHTLAKPGFSSTWTVNFQMFQLDLAKAKKLEVKLPTSVGSSKKQQSSRRTATSALLTVPKPLTVWITTDCGKFFRRWEYQITLPAFWETCMQVRKQQLELDIEQQTGSKLGKVYVRAVYCHPAYLTYR